VTLQQLRSGRYVVNRMEKDVDDSNSNSNDEKEELQRREEFLDANSATSPSSSSTEESFD